MKLLPNINSEDWVYLKGISETTLPFFKIKTFILTGEGEQQKIQIGYCSPAVIRISVLPQKCFSCEKPVYHQRIAWFSLATKKEIKGVVAWAPYKQLKEE